MKPSHDARNNARDSERYHIGTEFERLFLGVLPGRWQVGFADSHSEFGIHNPGRWRGATCHGNCRTRGYGFRAPLARTARSADPSARGPGMTEAGIVGAG